MDCRESSHQRRASRGYPGKNLAWLDISIVMAKLMFNFEIRPDETNHAVRGSLTGKVGRRVGDQYQTYDASVSLRDGPMVHFRWRGRQE